MSLVESFSVFVTIILSVVFIVSWVLTTYYSISFIHAWKLQILSPTYCLFVVAAFIQVSETTVVFFIKAWFNEVYLSPTVSFFLIILWLTCSSIIKLCMVLTAFETCNYFHDHIEWKAKFIDAKKSFVPCVIVIVLSVISSVPYLLQYDGDKRNLLKPFWFGNTIYLSFYLLWGDALPTILTIVATFKLVYDIQKKKQMLNRILNHGSIVRNDKEFQKRSFIMCNFTVVILLLTSIPWTLYMLVKGLHFVDVNEIVEFILFCCKTFSTFLLCKSIQATFLNVKKLFYNDLSQQGMGHASARFMYL